jgi:hypothetical protein
MAGYVSRLAGPRPATWWDRFQGAAVTRMLAQNRALVAAEIATEIRSAAPARHVNCPDPGRCVRCVRADQAATDVSLARLVGL